jgi:hypothetical protein
VARFGGKRLVLSPPHAPQPFHGLDHVHLGSPHAADGKTKTVQGSANIAKIRRALSCLQK